MVSQIKEASRSLDFEKAACIRDPIQSVRHLTEKKFVSVDSQDLDIIVVVFEARLSCVHILFMRYGKVLGSRSYFHKVPRGPKLGEVVKTFVGQFYLAGSEMRMLHKEILLNFFLSEKLRFLLY